MVRCRGWQGRGEDPLVLERRRYRLPYLPGFSIRWETSAFEVAASGDMAFGLGTNVTTINDPQGKMLTERGRGVTVWRKGADGKWRCVVDIWNAEPAAPPVH